MQTFAALDVNNLSHCDIETFYAEIKQSNLEKRIRFILKQLPKQTLIAKKKLIIPAFREGENWVKLGSFLYFTLLDSPCG